ncbi:hypothetical protein LSH36_328g03042 [Paralvinella palmiformis]|uniref:Hexosyltransferase n=1 Tax=Paralvinella palmiformis TaxID=53620 RepID=A0AAD9JG10_9ANNE|nr:hypothetical protein LSH36_328g03042 [Paralvinella palmiformis]
MHTSVCGIDTYGKTGRSSRMTDTDPRCPLQLEDTMLPEPDLLLHIDNEFYGGAAVGLTSRVHLYQHRMISLVSEGHSPLYPPPWFIRTIKTAAISTPVMLLLMLVIILAFKASQPPVVSLPHTTDDYVQRMELCKDIAHVPDDSANRTALAIYRVCKNLATLEKDFYSRRLDVVNVFNVTFHITGSRICTKDTEIVLLVHSYHDFVERRQAIRDTWGGAAVRRQWPGKPFSEQVRIAFVFGLHRNLVSDQELWKEESRYGDIVQGRFVDDYRNMTLKSLLGLKWVTKYCSMARYVIKSDDDMIINFPYLLSILRRTDMTWSIMGPLNVGAKVYRAKSKWALSKADFPFYYFPPYESGSAYVISMDLVQPLLDCSDYVPYIFVDDVYITGILGRILGVRHKRQNGFAYWTDKPPGACDIIKDRVITGTKMKPHLQHTVWNTMNSNAQC